MAVAVQVDERPTGHQSLTRFAAWRRHRGHPIAPAILNLRSLVAVYHRSRPSADDFAVVSTPSHRTTLPPGIVESPRLRSQNH